ncbi:MAG: serine/threonine protein kinase [Desulfurococcaceae archaeon]
MDGEVHRLEYDDDFVKFTLCFPKPSCEEYERRLKTLVDNGFTHLIEYGERFLNYRIIGKGFSSISVLANNRIYGLGLLKLRRLDSRRNNLEYEGFILNYLEKTNYVPKVFLWSRDFIFREFLNNCVSLHVLLREMWIKNDIDNLLYVFRRVINALYLLDLLEIEHTELNRPHGHIYWCNNVVKIIDWESSRLTSRPSNLTMFMSYVLHRSIISSNLQNLMKNELRKYCIELLKNYKISRKPGLVRDLIKFLEQLLSRQV